jgi:hypothetical protein
MSFSARRVVGLATMVACLAGSGAAFARNAHGFIESDQWACLVPLAGNDCGGGDTYAMLENWVAPHDISLENPVIGTEWREATQVCTPLGARWLGRGCPTFVSIGTGFDPDVVDWEEFLDENGLPREFVLGVAVTYVKNRRDEPLEVGLCTASDDSIQVWINDTLALNQSVCRPLDSGCAEVTPIILAPGVNRIAVLVWQGWGGFAFRLGFTKPNAERWTEADGDIEYLGACSAEDTPAELPFLTRSYRGAYLGCPDATHEVRLAGPGFDGIDSVHVTEELHGELAAQNVSNVSSGGVVETIRATTEPAGVFHALVVGTPCGPANSTTLSGETFTTRANTHGDIWTEGDAFEFAFQCLAGDFDLSVEIVAKRFPAEGRWGKFGLMMRQSLDVKSKLTAIVDHGPDLQDPARLLLRRTHLDSNSMSETKIDEADAEHAHPRFLRLTRRGATVEAWVSNTAGDGGVDPTWDGNWLSLGRDDWSGAPPESLLGFAYSVHDSSECEPGEIDWRIVHFDASGHDRGPPVVGASITWESPGAVLSSTGLSYSVAGPAGVLVNARGTAGGVATAGPGLLAFQVAPVVSPGMFDASLDIGEGGPCAPGSLSIEDRGTADPGDDAYTITASGSDVWNGGDQLHFVYKTLTGDFAIQAKLADVKPPRRGGRWGKYGLMARWDCRPNSAYFFVENATATDSACEIDGPRIGIREHGGINGGSDEPYALWWQDVFGADELDERCVPLRTNSRATDLRGSELNQAPWLRLVRRGHTCYGYASDDGKDWRALGSHSWPDPPDTLVVGAAVSSHAGCEVESVTFEEIEISLPAPLDVRVTDVDPLDGEVLASEDFDVADGDCPPSWTCDRSRSELPVPAIASRSLRVSTLGRDGEYGATSAFLTKALDPRDALLFDFDARFTYDVELGDWKAPADGFTFCLLGTRTGTDTLALRLGECGGGLGYKRMNMSRDESLARTKEFSLNSFAVEFDTWHNGDWENEGDGANVSGWDQEAAGGRGTGAYHIGLDVNSSVVSAQRNLELGVRDDRLPSIYDSQGIHARILYDHGHVKAWVRPKALPDGALLLVLDDEIEPIEVNAPRAFAGFTAGTGEATCIMEVDDFVVRKVAGKRWFHRGDADSSGKLEITDAVRLLGYLFRGGLAPTCLEAADADDNGVLEITDAIRILGFLFLGSRSLPAPGPPPEPCGPDGEGSRTLACQDYESC